MIKIQNISKSFNGQIVVDNLSLEAKTGEIVGLLGANGAGKSTTINMLLGFLHPENGSILIDGIDSKNNFKDIRKVIGYVPENVNLYPYLSGIENLDYFCKLNNAKYNSNQLEQILIECGLEKETHNKKIENYSKGMRQKVGIAIAYSRNAKVYLLDEPASGLDPLASNELSLLLKKLASNGATIIMASHDIFRVNETCDKICILKKGVLVKEIIGGSLSSKELEDVYINYIKN
jgi:ABC-2 type transport system ATP-binding protein